ncbi:uncharacterized protein LOC119663680 [Teleopsis dalmanni]|uniref:uncharacterized protein LOC119663680 n=1 Tax=Teleopsis dalmanni TaxID=139649 RepID=UPI0018CF9119|nr:uncharacterized protein LOC119663680 [Teleopsis dalmanni]
METATKLNNGTRLLHPTIFYNIDESSNCVIKQLYNKLTFDNCPSKRFQVIQPVWKELWTPNAWIFITPNLTTIHVICHIEREEIVLNYTGIIHISPDCVIHSKTIQLEGRMMKEFQSITHHVKPISMQNISIPDSRMHKITNETVIPLVQDLSTMLLYSARDAQDNMDQVNEISWKTIMTHQYWKKWVIGATAIIIIIFVGVLYYMCYIKPRIPSTSANNHTSPSTYDVAWSCT